jgi:hypothetical protein
MNAIQKLRQLHTEIARSGDGLKIVDAWATVARLLPRAVTDQAEAARVIKEQDAEGLDRLIDAIENPQPKASVSEADLASVTHDDKKAALRAFHKRLKLARLNDESKLGSRDLTGGKKSEIDAVEAPREFPPKVWKALVADGTLKDAGGGFYADASERPRI